MEGQRERERERAEAYVEGSVVDFGAAGVDEEVALRRISCILRNQRESINKEGAWKKQR
jgi:hypothetical protein